MTDPAVMIGGTKLSPAHTRALKIAVTTFHDELDAELGPTHHLRPTLTRLEDILQLLLRQPARA